MHLTTRNVNTAFKTLVQTFHEGHFDGSGEPMIVKRPSRNGQVMMIDEPVTITYTHPKERVLFNAARDANPFFHVYEALWMLAGRNDIAPLTYYVKKYADFSDDGKTANGAYGYRWRHAVHHDFDWDGTGSARSPDTKNIDQLDVLVAHLKMNPESRRAVLQMWNVEDDLLKIGGMPILYDEIGHRGGKTGFKLDYDEKTVGSKDVCCNLSVMFSLRQAEFDPEEAVSPNTAPAGKPSLDMTVTNRSNDLVWGLLGANYVHFSFLQEYLASRLGVEVGKYHHFTNNLHAYEWNWKPKEWLAAMQDPASDVYRNEPYLYLPFVRDPKVFDEEVKSIVGNGYGDGVYATIGRRDWSEPFLAEVAAPMICAHAAHKEGDTKKAIAWAANIEADDWRIAATNWLERRLKKEVVE